MTTVVWPSTLVIGTADYGYKKNVQFSFGRDDSARSFALPGGRWYCTLGFDPDLESRQRPALEALIVDLEGGANQLQMPFLWRQHPNGTLTGSPTLAQAAVSGARSFQLANCNGTLKKGDFIGVNGQNFMVLDDVTPSGGNMTARVNSGLRVAASLGAAVTWDKPAVLWIPRSSVAGPFPYRSARVRPGFQVELVEYY
jgi:hypothetical protein